MRRILFILFQALVLFACSVKEDRTQCPCFVNLMLSGGKEKTARLHIWDEDSDASSTLTVGSVCEMSAPRGTYKWTAFSGNASVELKDGKLIVPLGNQMDELYAVTESINTESDERNLSMKLRKQFAFVHIIMKDSGLSEYPYYMKIKGDACGFDLDGMEPVQGNFEVMLTPVVGTYFRVSLPRQFDSSLSLEFYDRNMMVQGLAGPESIPIGRFIEESGYDWTQPDLKDMDVSIDYAAGSISVSVGDWNVIRL